MRLTTTLATAALASTLAGLLGLTAVSAQAAVHHKHHHPAPVCKDKVLCHKIDGLSGQMKADTASLSDTIKAGQTEESDYHKQQLTYSDSMLASLKAIQAQGGQSYSAILLNFEDKPVAQGDNPATMANQICVDSGFKTGKPVDVSAKRGFFSGGGTYLKSVVCTF